MNPDTDNTHPDNHPDNHPADHPNIIETQDDWLDKVSEFEYGVYSMGSLEF